MNATNDPAGRPSQAIPSRTTDPALRPGVVALSLWLRGRGYAALLRDAICDHAAREGTLEGAPGLHAAARADADDVFCGALPAVPYDAPEWGD